VLVQDGRAVGVALEDGAQVEAPLVLSNADPKRTLFGLVGRERLPDSLAADLDALDFRSPSLKINVALSRLPQFAARPGSGVQPHHAGTIHVGATNLDALEASYEAARAGRLPERPMIELTLPSALDPDLAPPGRHVASLFVQHVPPEPNGWSWSEQRDRFADRVFALVDEVAPGFADSVIERDVLAPPDLERIFGLTGGNIFQGAMSLNRLLFLRPLPGWSRYQTPIRGLYLCGAGTHPGGGVMGACGRNAAMQALRDRSR
jgi:phytoene dehydrogenase-like protein